jgi:formylglycine-generating enzyme required for sulfatase activity
VFNLQGSIDSSQGTIWVKPKITIQPSSSINIGSGSTASLSVVANGTTPLSYQWYRGQAGDTSNPVGTNSSSFTTPTLNDITSYWVRVSNNAGSTDSITSSITVKPSIIVQPTSVTIDSGTSATFSVEAIGPGILRYEWFRYVDPQVSVAVGGNSPTYTTPALTGTEIYWVKVSNEYGFVDSTYATVDMMSTIPPSTFWMGRTSGDADTNAPPVLVNMNTFYAIGKYEVTRALWSDVRLWGMLNGYTDLPEGSAKAQNHPVTGINWYDAVKWCNARSQKEGLTPCYTFNGGIMKTGINAPVVNWTANGYRLPTEAEWEKAARGGVSGKRFPWGGDTISHNEANYRFLSLATFTYDTNGYNSSTWHPTYSKYPQSVPYTSPVGSFPSNNFGLYDMSGNNSEWCWDWYNEFAYTNNSTNPKGPSSGTAKVVRGGGWDTSSNYCRCAGRNSLDPSIGANYTVIGLRVARSINN